MLNQPFKMITGTLAALLLTLGAGAALAAESVLFIGNSFTYGAGSEVRTYRTNTVMDLNSDGSNGVGGVPALFELFTDQAGLDYAVSIETIGGSTLERHYTEKLALIDKPWDNVVMHDLSVFVRDDPGNPTSMIEHAGLLAEIFHAKNPQVNVLLFSTWSRADQVYPPDGHWHGTPIETMALDLRAGYDAAAASPYIQGVVPVGEAWNRAFAVGFADPNPYDGIEPNQVNLWADDSYHGSTYGYYLEALMVFGTITGLDPLSLGPQEIAASELGISPEQATMLQQIAHDELAASTDL